MSKKLSIGYQVYSAREEAQKDLDQVLGQLAEMGYDGVEFAGFYEHSAKDVKAMLKKHGLAAASSHVPLALIEKDMEGVLDYHEEIGCKHIAVPYLDDKTRPGAPGFAKTLQTIYTFGRMCKKRDIPLMYHNHDFEFIALSGQTALDFLFDAIPAELLKTEIDTCWVKYAGAEPAAYVRKYAGRCPVVHLKDYVGVRGDRPPYALIGIDSAPGKDEGSETPFMFKPLGYGCQNVAELVDAAEESGAKWVIVEQDESPERPPLEAAKMSLETLKKII